jgi:hypothetical protein
MSYDAPGLPRTAAATDDAVAAGRVCAKAIALKSKSLPTALSTLTVSFLTARNRPGRAGQKSMWLEALPKLLGISLRDFTQRAEGYCSAGRRATY